MLSIEQVYPKINKKTLVSGFIKEKHRDFMRGADNYTWDELLEKARDFKRNFCK